MREKETTDKAEKMPKKVKKTAQLPMSVRHNYRDTVFRMLFREKKNLLMIFNAVHGTSYENAEELEVTTLENAVYMSMKNDLSCVLGMQLDLYEHQSTVNPNMPLRDLFYVAKLLENRIKTRELYARKRIVIPAPKFIVFYNGEEQQPERREYRLSDNFAEKGAEVNLELVVVQLNINPGYNTELAEKCPVLREYIQYTEQVRRYRKNMPLSEAVEAAVEHCIREGILSEFLRKNRSEVIPMILYEYDEEGHMELVREEGREEEERRFIYNMLRANISAEVISECAERPLEYVLQLKQQMQEMC